MRRSVAGWDVQDHVAGESMAANVADESNLRGGGGGRRECGEMELKVVPEDGAVDTAALIAGAVSADEDDGGRHGRALDGNRRR